MTTLASSPSAQTRVQANWERNLNALRDTQPDLAPWVMDTSLDVEWVLGRDAQLTALEPDGGWLAGCSLPRRAARAMLAKMEIRGAVACFLAPSHAAQVTAALEKLRPEQAIVAILPDMRDLALLLHCDDLSQPMRGHRIWFAAGAAWEIGLERLLDDRIGLATPTQFIRAQDADGSETELMIASAQKVFAEANTRRSAMVQDLKRRTHSAPSRRLCVVAPTRFRLWNDIGHTLLSVCQSSGELEVVPFDADDPLCSSPAALLKAASECGAILTANTSRSDLPGLVGETIPWITWVTTSRIPSSALASPNDQLIVADPSFAEAAVKSGWAKDRVHMGGWPRVRNAGDRRGSTVSLIADTSALDTPKDLVEYSSHGLLWEMIRAEMLQNPFVIGKDIEGYLRQRMRRLTIGEETVSQTRFIERLILPAYQQGLARTLIAARIPLKLWGDGWEDLAEFKSFAAGRVGSRQMFQDAVNQSRAVVHAWLHRPAHPIEAVDAPLIRDAGRGAEQFVREARNVLAKSAAAPTPQGSPALSGELVVKILSPS